MTSYDAFTCEGAWAVVEATLGSGGTPDPEVFLLHHDVDIWVLQPPEVACVQDELPSSVRDIACPVG